MFSVQWYDVGKSDLAGLKGVRKVTRGFRELKEINTFWYDTGQITVGEMVAALEKARAYQGTDRD